MSEDLQTGPVSSAQRFQRATKEHNLGADLLRGIAILSVILYHAVGATYGNLLPWQGWLRDFSCMPVTSLLWFYPLSWGWAGVALFFVLSGFCIHLSFLKQAEFGMTNFYWRRFWRIAPAYLVALAAFILFSPQGAKAPTPEDVLTHSLFLHNWFGRTIFTINPSFWSIATEVQLYLLYPVLLLLRARFGIARALLITLAIGCAWRVVTIATWGLPDHVINAGFCSPFMTWFDWSLGAYVAEHYAGGVPTFQRRKTWMIVLLALFVLSTAFKPTLVFSFTLAACVSALVLDSLLRRDTTRSVSTRALVFVGLISYSLYLWHQPLIFLVMEKVYPLGGRLLTGLAYVIVIVIVATLSFFFLEKPGIRVGHRLSRYFWKKV